MADVPGDPGGAIPITRPVLGEEEIAALRRPLENGWVVQGREVAAFEESFAAFAGVEHAIATTSCTTALHLAVAALDVKPGDEVIVPAFTWVSTANVVEYMGATPVFCDIQLDTFNIDPGKIEELITERTVGIIPVHLFGLCADMGAVAEIAERHSLWMVEDAACGLGATMGGRHAGALSEIGCFSFHPRKSITTGEGGMLVTSDTELASLARTLRDHGASRSDFARHAGEGAFRLADYEHLGFNYRMTDIQGALGQVQMQKAPDILAERRRIADRYAELLAPLEWLAAPSTPEGYEHGWQAYVCLFRPDEPTLANMKTMGGRRDAIMARMEAAGVSTRPGTHAAAGTGFYRRKYSLAPEDHPVAHVAERLSIALPLFPGLTDDELARVVRELEAAYVTV